MKFYYYNCLGNHGTFEEDDIVKAIYTAWNIEANLFLIDKHGRKLIFAPWESDDFNSEMLEEFGYKLIDGDSEREIVEIKTGKIIKYDWEDVIQLN